jgi:hypothetical protein
VGMEASKLAKEAKVVSEYIIQMSENIFKQLKLRIAERVVVRTCEKVLTATLEAVDALSILG